MARPHEAAPAQQTALKRLLFSAHGQSLVEYVLLLSLIMVVAVALVTLFGNDVLSLLNSAAAI